MVVYSSCGKYIESCATLEAKIAAIDVILEALENQALSAAGKEGVLEYKLNDGQTIIQETYRGSVSIAKAINDFETIKQRYINRLTGRVFRAVDGKNFPTNRYGRNGYR